MVAARPRSALSNALRSLGLPCTLPPDKSTLALDVPVVATALDAAYTRSVTVRRHICPLDLADDLPPITFGSARVAQFTAQELEKLFDAPELARNFPTLPLESKRLAQFHWLVESRRRSKSTHDPRRARRRLCS